MWDLCLSTEYPRQMPGILYGIQKLTIDFETIDIKELINEFEALYKVGFSLQFVNQFLD